MQELLMTAEQIEQLADWLSGEDTPTKTMSLYEAEGYLFALICAPEPVENVVWIKQILAGDISQISDDRLFDLMAFYNHIAHRVFDIGYQLSDALILDINAIQNFTSESKLHLWSLGFVKGLHNYGDKLLAATEGEINTALKMTLEYLGYFSDLTQATEISKLEQVDLAQMNYQVYSLLHDFVSGFAQLIEAAAIDSGLYLDDGWD